MKLLANRRIRIIPPTVIYISRQLEGKGKISVQVGQEVTPAELIGQSIIAAGLRSVDLSHKLGTSAKEAKKYLQRAIGQSIFRGELLALKPGGFLSPKKEILSPTDGTVEAYDEKSGELTISLMPHQKNLAAAVYGIVAKVDNLKNEVIIKTQATEIYGVFGTGKSREGILKVLGQRGDLLSKFSIKADMSDMILVGGASVYPDAIQAAISKRVSGLISGGMNAGDFRSMAGGRLTFPPKFDNDIGIGLFVTEGFGSVPIGEDIFDTLLDFHGRFAILIGNQGRLILPTFEASCMSVITKTALPSVDTGSVNFLSQVESQELQVGQKVRIIGYPYLGEEGEVAAIDEQPSRLLSGIMVNLITIQAKSRKLKVPYTNVEIIG